MDESTNAGRWGPEHDEACLASAILEVKNALRLTDDEAWGPPIPGSTAEAFQTLINSTYSERARDRAVMQVMGDYCPS